jgi:hypothetical protein
MSKADVVKNVPQKQKGFEEEVPENRPGSPTKFLLKLNLRSVGGTHHCITQHPRDCQTNASKGGIESL